MINFYSSNRRICFLSFFYINKLCFSIIKTKHKVFVNMNYSNIIYWVFFGHLWLKDNSLRFSLPKIIYYIQVDKMMCTSCRRLAYMEYTPLLVIINISRTYLHEMSRNNMVSISSTICILDSCNYVFVCISIIAFIIRVVITIRKWQIEHFCNVM